MGKKWGWWGQAWVVGWGGRQEAVGWGVHPGEPAMSGECEGVLLPPILLSPGLLSVPARHVQVPVHHSECLFLF